MVAPDREYILIVIQERNLLSPLRSTSAQSWDLLIALLRLGLRLAACDSCNRIPKPKPSLFIPNSKAHHARWDSTFTSVAPEARNPVRAETTQGKKL